MKFIKLNKQIAIEALKLIHTDQTDSYRSKNTA